MFLCLINTRLNAFIVEMENNNKTILTCHGNDTYGYEDIVLLSKLCTNGSNVNGWYDCVPASLYHCPYRISLGVWALIIMFIGVLGNLLTLLAIPYAARRKRYPLLDLFYPIPTIVI